MIRRVPCNAIDFAKFHNANGPSRPTHRASVLNACEENFLDTFHGHSKGEAVPRPHIREDADPSKTKVANTS